MPAARERPTIGRVLDSPILGIAPWIVFSIVVGPGRLAPAVAISLALSLFVLIADRVRGRSVKLLACADVAFFAVLLLVGLTISAAGRDWLANWAGVISNVALAVIALGSMAVRMPFTIQYARELVPSVHWSSPVFVRTNQVITGAWAAAFGVSAIAGGYGSGVLHDPNNLWTGWVIQIAAILIALRFTEWYPDVAESRSKRAQGLPAGAPPTIGKLLIPMTGWLVPSGILSLAFGAGPDWLGIGLIVAGVLLSRALARTASTS